MLSDYRCLVSAVSLVLSHQRCFDAAEAAVNSRFHREVEH